VSHDGVVTGSLSSGCVEPAVYEEALQAITQELSPAGRRVIETGMRMLDYLDAEIAPLDRELSPFARRQPGCRALRDKLYGVGFMTASAIVVELGDTRRFASSDAVRYAGLTSPCRHPTPSAPGHLSR
jgi:transposase